MRCKPPVIDRAQAQLTTARLGREARFFRSVDSTMQVASAWARDGAPDGALVLADHQTAGRGRHNRAWRDAPGDNLLMSLVLRPHLAPGEMGLVPLLAGLSVVEATEAEIAQAARPRLKWPNDVVVSNRKMAGILTKSLWRGPHSTLLVGIGVNVNQIGFPVSLRHLATSLAQEVGRPLDRAALLARLLNRFEGHLDTLSSGGASALLRTLEAHLIGLGDPVVVHRLYGEGPPIEGLSLGLATDGALRVSTPDGVRPVYAGEVTLRDPHART